MRFLVSANGIVACFWVALLVALAACFAAPIVFAQTQGFGSGTVCSDSANLLPLAQELASPAKDKSPAAVRHTLEQVEAQAYPEIEDKDLRVGTFRSKSTYFETRFSFSRFFFFRRMRYFVDVNPELFASDAPADGVCAILAHELAHVADLSHGNRFRLFRLVRMLSTGYTIRLERKADLEAIRRGFGPALVSYRNWVYVHVPPAKMEEKKRNYFSPQEIATIQELARANPQLFDYWKRKVPLNEKEIEDSAAATK